MPSFSGAKALTPITAQVFNPFDGIDTDPHKAQQKIAAAGGEKVKGITRKLGEAAVGEGSGTLLAALDELRSAIAPTAQEQLVVGAAGLDTQRRLQALLESVGGPEKLVKDVVAVEPSESSPAKETSNRPEPEPETTLPNVTDKRDAREKFAVTVDRSTESTLGITVCWADQKHLVVVAVNGTGLLKEWNDKHPTHLQVQLGDYIVSVNGESLPVMQLKAMIYQAKGIFCFEIQPHSKYTVNVSKTEADSLGLHVTNKPHDRTLLVTEVQDGLVNSWNSSNKNREVVAGDRICEVNGKGGSGQTLRKMVNEAQGEIALTMFRFEH